MSWVLLVFFGNAVAGELRGVEQLPRVQGAEQVSLESFVIPRCGGENDVMAVLKIDAELRLEVSGQFVATLDGGQLDALREASAPIAELRDARRRAAEGGCDVSDAMLVVADERLPYSTVHWLTGFADGAGFEHVALLVEDPNAVRRRARPVDKSRQRGMVAVSSRALQVQGGTHGCDVSPCPSSDAYPYGVVEQEVALAPELAWFVTAEQRVPWGTVARVFARVTGTGTLITAPALVSSITLDIESNDPMSPLYHPPIPPDRAVTAWEVAADADVAVLRSRWVSVHELTSRPSPE